MGWTISFSKSICIIELGRTLEYIACKSKLTIILYHLDVVYYILYYIAVVIANLPNGLWHFDQNHSLAPYRKNTLDTVVDRGTI